MGCRTTRLIATHSNTDYIFHLASLSKGGAESAWVCGKNVLKVHVLQVKLSIYLEICNMTVLLEFLICIGFKVLT